MTAFTNKGASRAELKTLNNWRLHYRVNLISEICSATGDAIQKYCLEYNHTSKRQTISKITWPIQAKPDKTSFKLWKRYINACFVNPYNKQLPPLGEWHTEEVETTSPCLSYISIQNQHIYITQPSGKYHKHTAISIRQHSAKYDPLIYQIEETISRDCIPADLIMEHMAHKVQFTVPSTNYMKSTPKPISKWRQIILQHLKIPDMEILTTAFSSPTNLTIVLDGGVHNYEGNFGLVIADKYNN
jgi:hypothetical protein